MPDTKFLQAECGVRYWEDATVNGVEDEDGSRIPFREGDAWRPLIDIDTGCVVGWPEGTTADIHYKICDDGRYTLLDADQKPLCTLDDYVPRIMCPGGHGYGDYVIMTIGADGRIADWKRDLGAAYINAKCPRCGSNVLTPQDFHAVQTTLRIVAWVNKWFWWWPSKGRWVEREGTMDGSGKVRLGPATPVQSAQPQTAEGDGHG